ncbi:MAG: ATPase [Symploca sp. SIO2G7]|nr:ATPase [Symploca sp. SIO2G7]
MKLIADSGSTKTNWVLVKDGEVKKTIRTIGLNPYFHTKESIIAVVEDEILPTVDIQHLASIHFYGAGCSSEKPVSLIQESFKRVFQDVPIEVEHDLLAAARALCGKKPGLASILGTGANTCYYDGKQILKRVRALGFILGDEGSGSYMGKRFIKDYLHDEVPEEVRLMFAQDFKLTDADIHNSVYKNPMPNRFLASFAAYISQHKDIPYFQELILSGFDDFIQKHILRFEESRTSPINIIGAIGYLNRELLEEAAAKYQIQVGLVIQDPMENLIKFHSKD